MDERHERTERRLINIGARLRELRKAKGYRAYDEFAFKQGINRSTYGRMEKGRNMRMDTFLDVIDALDITLEEFYEGMK